jgi:hypothetical protein
MIFFALALVTLPTPAKPNPYMRYVPHTLVISDGNAITRIDYKDGASCERARDEVRRQTDSRLTNNNPNIIYGAPRVTAFCVPR